MTQLDNLRAADRRVVDAKLAELEGRTGKSWVCEITRQNQLNNHGYVLEVSVNGQTKRPVVLAQDGSAIRICQELDRMFEALA